MHVITIVLAVWALLVAAVLAFYVAKEAVLDKSAQREPVVVVCAMALVMVVVPAPVAALAILVLCGGAH